MPTYVVGDIHITDPRYMYVAKDERSQGMGAAIAYYRVSTQRQGRSGLGIEAQKSAVARFAETEGF